MLVPFDIPPGLFSDDTAFAMPGAWEVGSNVRFKQGRPQVIGGWMDAIDGGTLTGVCRNARAWLSFASLRYIAFGTHSKLQVFADGGLYDITPSGLSAGSIDSSGGTPGWGSGGYSEGTYSSPASVFYARTWTFDNYGDSLIANPRGGKIYQWDLDTGNLATVVTNAPETVTTVLVTPERQLLAFGCEEEVSGDLNPLCIRGSDIEDITDWTTTASNNAFEHILEGGGRIVAARQIGSYVAVWTDNRVYLGQYIGDPGQTYRFDPVAEHCGLAGPNAVAIMDQTAIWLGTDYQFRIWTLGGVPGILSCPIHRDFRDNLDTDQLDKLVMVTVSQFEEVWLFYPDTRDGNEASRFVAYSFAESANGPVWFTGEIGRTQAMDAGATASPLMSTAAGYSYFHELGETADGTPIDWSIRSTDTYLDEGGMELLIRRLIPDFEQQDGDVDVTIYMRRYPMATAVEHGPYTVGVGDEKTDFRARGKLAAVEFAGAGFVRIGKPIFDAVAMGRR